MGPNILRTILLSVRFHFNRYSRYENLIHLKNFVKLISSHLISNK